MKNQDNSNRWLDLYAGIFGHTRCLRLDELIRYKKDELSRPMRMRVEKHLVKCALCSGALEGLEQTKAVDRIEPIIGSVNRDLRQHLIGNNIKWTRITAIAAALLIGILFSLYLAMRQSLPERLFAENFKPLPNTEWIIRGETGRFPFNRAMTHYELGWYEEASEILQTVVEREPDKYIAHFYLGVALLSIDQPSRALPHLQQVLQDPQNEFIHDAKWYLALGYLKMKNIAQTKQYLRQVRTQDKYRNLADQLLKQLTKISD